MEIKRLPLVNVLNNNIICLAWLDSLATHTTLPHSYHEDLKLPFVNRHGSFLANSSRTEDNFYGPIHISLEGWSSSAPNEIVRFHPPVSADDSEIAKEIKEIPVLGHSTMQKLGGLISFATHQFVQM